MTAGLDARRVGPLSVRHAVAISCVVALASDPAAIFTTSHASSRSLTVET